MREDDLAGLAVVGSAPGQVTPNGRANHGRSLEATGRAPTGHNQFIANLHHGRPDVIEELYFSDGLKTSHSHPDAAAYDRRFRKGRIENRSEERRVGKECRSRWSRYD